MSSSLAPQGSSREPDELYELVGDPPETDGMVLVVALTGFGDVGDAVGLAVRHMLGISDSRVVASFDADRLVDYRSRRPVMLYAQDHWEGYQPPRLRLHLLRDAAGADFLLLAGPEPDLLWERFAAAVRELARRFGVRLTIGVNSAPADEPHTRPLGVTTHATRRELIGARQPWLPRAQLPGSAMHLIEYQLGRDGRDAVCFAVHVPHYLAQIPYPAAAEALVESVARAGDLVLPTAGLRAEAEQVRRDIDRQVADTGLADTIRGLEHDYDALHHGPGQDLLSGGSGPLPTAEEIGAEAERFLAEQAGHGDQAP